MAQKKLTPTQDYLKRMVFALTEYINDPENTELADEILMQVLERPKTLRAALNAALYRTGFSITDKYTHYKQYD